MKKITSLSAQQQDELRMWHAEYLAHGISTLPADRPRAEAAFAAAYRTIGKEPVPVIWCDSPLTASIMFALLNQLDGMKDSLGASLQVSLQDGLQDGLGASLQDSLGASLQASLQDSLWASLQASLQVSLWASLRASLWDSLGDGLGASLQDSLGASLQDSLQDGLGASLQDSLGASLQVSLWASLGASLEASLGDSLWDSLGASLRASLWASLRDSLRDSKFTPQYTYWWGQQDLYWVAFYKFCAQIGVPYKTPDAEKLQIMDEIGKSCMWWYSRDGLIIACERPSVVSMDSQNRLHSDSGPAVAFRDGWKIHAIRGVRVPEYIVERPNEITVEKIEAENNAEIRRIMIQRYEQERYMQDSGASVVHELPENYFLKGLQTARLLRKERVDDSPIVMIDCLNSTPEPDGTTKRYMLRVQPDAYDGEASRNCHAAMASTWRNRDGSLYFKNWKDYAPSIET